MEYKDFIKPGEKVLHFPDQSEYGGWPWYDINPQVVTIGGYRPYYRDGSPDPKPDEYCEWCYVEIEGCTTYGEKQLILDSLKPIIKVSEDTEVLYNNKLYKVYGHDEDVDYTVLINEDGIDDDELMVVETIDTEEHAEIFFLGKEDLKKLRSEICVGSIFMSDYHNSLGLTLDEVYSLSEEYLQWLDDNGKKDTQNNFADFVLHY